MMTLIVTFGVVYPYKAGIFEYILYKFLIYKKCFFPQNSSSINFSNDDIENYSSSLLKRLQGSFPDDNFHLIIIKGFENKYFKEVLQYIKTNDLKRIVFVPIYSHFAFNVTGYFFRKFRNIFIYHDIFFDAKEYVVYCFSLSENLIQKYSEAIDLKCQEMLLNKCVNIRVVFVANYIDSRNEYDPYPIQILESVKKIFEISANKYKYSICYCGDKLKNNVFKCSDIENDVDLVMDLSAKMKEGVIFVPIAFLANNLQLSMAINENCKKKFFSSGGIYYSYTNPFQNKEEIVDVLYDVILKKIGIFSTWDKHTNNNNATIGVSP